MLISLNRSYDTDAYSNSSCLICVFNDAKDKANSRFSRLNSSIVEVKSNIFNLIDLIQVSESKHHYVTLQIARLHVYFIVHPDSASKFGALKFPHKFNIINLYIYTYEQFFSDVVVGSLSNGRQHHKFLKNL